MTRQGLSPITAAAILRPERIIAASGPQEKTGLIKKLSELVALDCPQFTAQAIAEKVLQREQGISTTLDTGLSIPHARLEGIGGFFAALAVISAGMADPAQPGVSVKAMFLFVSPASPAFFKKHLQLLSSLSSLFQPAFVEKLASLSTPQEIAREIVSNR